MDLKLKVLLVDDEQISLDVLNDDLKNFDFVEVVGLLKSGEVVIKFLQNNKVDVIFLDIEMNDIDGFEVANHIRKYYSDTMIVFLTGHTDFALESYEYYPTDFLTKPLNLLRLDQTLSRIKNIKSQKMKERKIKIGVNVEGGFELIDVDEISYIERRGRKTCIICSNGEVFNAKDSLQQLEMIFENYDFFRSHQSFIIPIKKIKKITLDEFKRTYNIQLKGVKELLPLSRDKYGELKHLLLKRGMKFF